MTQPATTMPGASRTTFGLSRDQGRRIEVTLLLRRGGSLTVVDEVDEAITAEGLAAYARSLASDIEAKASRSFTDNWNATGQRAWVSLGEVVGYSLRPAK
jgi:hypothetical protein